MALYQTLGTLELDCEDLIAAHTPHFTNQNKIKLFNKARAKKGIYFDRKCCCN